MTKVIAYAFPINPQPWAMGTVTPYKRVAPNKTLVAYQSAIRDSLADAGAVILDGPYSIRFTFARTRERFINPAGKHGVQNQADATNMQKATEDAMQGVLIGNDRDVFHVESDNLPQGIDEFAYVVIELKYECEWEDRHFPHGPTVEFMAAESAMLVKHERDQEERSTEQEVWKP